METNITLFNLQRGTVMDQVTKMDLEWLMSLLLTLHKINRDYRLSYDSTQGIS